MTDLFHTVFNMSITASILVLAVMILRLLLKNAPRRICVFLWCIVAIRLILPFTPESPLSLIPRTEWVPQSFSVTEAVTPVDPIQPDTVPDSAQTAPVNPSILVVPQQPSEPVIEISRENISVPQLLSFVWCTGMALMLLYMLLSTLRIHHRIRHAQHLRNNIFLCSNIDVPFVFGIVHPRIFLPTDIDEHTAPHIISHEQTHIRCGDHLWKVLGFLLLTVHWFNPLIWISFLLFCRDIELACDERVIRVMDPAARADYSQVLLDCSTKNSRIGICPLAFGEIGVKTRIKSVLNYQKPSFWIVGLSIIVCVAVTVCLLTNPVVQINHMIDAQLYNYDAITAGDPSLFETTEVCVTGEIKTNWRGRSTFIGEIRIAGLPIHNVDVDLSEATPLLRFYSGSRLVTSAYILAHTPNLDQMAIVIFETEEENRKLLLCNMTYEEAIRMQKINEIPDRIKNGTLYSYKKEGTSQEIHLSILNDGIFFYTEGDADTIYSQVSGEWQQIGDSIILTEYDSEPDRANHFRFDGKDLIFMENRSSNFSHIKIEDGAHFQYRMMLNDKDMLHSMLQAKQLSRNDVIALSQKGYDLTWDDFIGYIFTETGSGLYIRVYEIDDTFSVWVGGTSLLSEPMYVYLNYKGDSKAVIDIRDGGAEDFIKQYTDIESTEQSSPDNTPLT